MNVMDGSIHALIAARESAYRTHRALDRVIIAFQAKCRHTVGWSMHEQHHQMQRCNACGIIRLQGPTPLGTLTDE